MVKKRHVWLGLTPGVSLLFLLFVASLSIVAIRSLTGDSGFSFDSYSLLFSDKRFLSSMLFSTFVAVVSTALTCVLAVVSALLYARTSSRMMLVVYQLPLAVPYLVAGLGVLLLFSQSGLISRLLYTLDVLDKPSDFPALVHSGYGVSIIATYVWKQVPFLGMLIISVLRSFNVGYFEVARNLGASQRQCFRYITLPCIIPAIIPGSVILLAYNFGAVEVPFLLGRPHPSMISLLAYRLYTNNVLDQNVLGLALCICSFIVACLLVLLYGFVTRRFSLRS